MNKKEYLYELRKYLQGFPEDEVKDILSDYEEHFHIGMSKGKTEEEISNELGKPRDIAKTYKGNYREDGGQREGYDANPGSDDTIRRLLIGILLLFFNLIIVLGPFIAIVGLIIGGYALSLAFVIGGFIACFGSPMVLLTPLAAPHILTSLAFGVAFMALGILGFILFLYLSKQFIQLTVKYANWNLNLINGQEVK